MSGSRTKPSSRLLLGPVPASDRLPPLEGRPVRIEFRSRLLSQRPRGHAVHAATSIRGRLILLDAALRRNRAEHDRILLHELFHFVWARLGNPLRWSWEELIASERDPCGELGWSAEWRKAALTTDDRARRSARWREYLCESFCDTAAWFYTGRARHDEFTLRAADRARRGRWFRQNLSKGPLSI
jgi:hypothetical protein